MSDLTYIEKKKLEALFGMGSGYVLGPHFSSRTFAEFVKEHTGRDIFDARYVRDTSGSKAQCLRGFWVLEANHLVGRLTTAIIDYGQEFDAFEKTDPVLVVECRKIASRLCQQNPVQELDALSGSVDEKDFETLAGQVRDAITKNKPEAALDRLHTFIIKYVRSLCEHHGIATSREKPLHSLFGEYVKELRRRGHLESEMTERILKSSISVLEAFNHVRNEQSFAHDNPVLNYDESLLILNHIVNSVRFLRSLEARISSKPAPVRTAGGTTADFDDDIPF